jgi:ankyrin repeat protein
MERVKALFAVMSGSGDEDARSEEYKVDLSSELSRVLCPCLQHSDKAEALALLFAAAEGDLELIRFLIEERHLDPNTTTRLADHSHIASCPRNEALSSRKKMNPGPGWPPVCAAATRGHAHVVHYLIEHGAAPDAFTLVEETRPEVKYFPLYVACARGHREVVQVLLKYRSCYDINQVQQQGYNVVIGACMMGNEDPQILDMVLAAGANVNHLDPRGGSAIFLCAQHGRPEFMKILFRYGASCSPRPAIGHDAAQRRNSDPIHIAASRNHVSSVVELLTHGADPNAKMTGSDITPLSLAAEAGFVECVKVLLDFKADPNAKDASGVTALHRACEKMFPEIIKLLLNAGANPEIMDCQNRSALMISVARGFYDAVSLLLEAGAKTNFVTIEGVTLFEIFWDSIMTFAISYAQVIPRLKLLLQYGLDVNQRCSDSLFPIHFACCIADIDTAMELVSFLVSIGADIESKDHLGITPLAVAVSLLRPRLVELFLSLGANPQAKDYRGSNLFVMLGFCGSGPWSGHSYVDANACSVALILQRQGIDMNQPNDEGALSLTCALERGNPQLVECLMSFPGCDLDAFMGTFLCTELLMSTCFPPDMITAVNRGFLKHKRFLLLSAFHARLGKATRVQSLMLNQPLFDQSLIREVMSFL